MWKMRNLSLNGKVLILKALGMSKFTFLASNTTFPAWVEKEINTCFYDFL